MTENILSIWLIAASGIQLGTLWIMKMSILPMLNVLPYGSYVKTCQLIDMHIFHPIAVWNGVIAGLLGIVAAVLAPTSTVTILYVVGSLGMAVVGITSEGVNRPIWRQIEKWEPERTAAEWDSKRRTWHLAHQTRTFGAVGAVGAFIAADVVLAMS